MVASSVPTGDVIVSDELAAGFKVVGSVDETIKIHRHIDL